MAPRKVIGSTTIPNSIGTVRGSKRVPSVRPRAADVKQASGASVSSTGQLKFRCTGVAGTTAATGNTIMAAMIPWQAPATILPTATIDTGNGAGTRSSISLV